MFGKKKDVCECVRKPDLALLDSIEFVGENTPEETVNTGKTFEDNAGSAISTLWIETFKKLIRSYYYNLAHLDDKARTDTMVAELSGRIKQLEELLDTPRIYIMAKDEIERENSDK